MAENMAGAIKAGTAYIEIAGDTSKFNKSMNDVQLKLNALGDSLIKWGKRMTVVGAAIQAPLDYATKRFASLAQETQEMSRVLGISVESFSNLSYAAKMTDTSVSSVVMALRRVQMAVAAASQGGKDNKMADLFKQMGLRVEELQKLKPEEQLYRIIDAINQFGSKGDRMVLAQQLLGRSFFGMVKMIDLGSVGIKKLGEENTRLGGTMSGEMASKGAALTDMFKRMGQAMIGLQNVIGETLAPMFTKFTMYLTNLVSNFRRWLALHPELITQLWKFASALVAIGVAMMGLGAGIKYLSLLASPGGLLAMLLVFLVYISGALDPVIAKFNSWAGSTQVLGSSIKEWLESARQSFSQVWEFIKGIFSDAGPMAKTGIEMVIQILRSAGTRIKAWLQELWGVIADQMGSMFLNLARIINDQALSLLEAGGTINQAAAAALQPFGKVSMAAGMGLIESGKASKIAGAQTHKEADAERERTAAMAVRFGVEADRYGQKFKSRTGELVEGIKAIFGPRIEPIIKKFFGPRVEQPESIMDVIGGGGQPFAEITGAETGKKVLSEAASMAGTAMGTFSAEVAMRFGTATFQNKLLENTQRIADNTDELVDQGPENEMVFQGG